MNEYAFDVKLWAVCRVKARSVTEARRMMLDALDCVPIGFTSDTVTLTDGSIEDDSGRDSELIEINGEAV